jgi:flap endonuclease 1 (EC 3.1.-.-)
MARRGTAEYAGTEDYDALLFGAPRTLRQLTSSGAPERMNLAATLNHHDLSWEQLVDAALLCGTDFNDGISGIGPVTAVDLLHDHEDLFGVLEARDDHIENPERLRRLFLDPAVEDVSVETTVEPELGAAREYVTDEWGVAREEVERGFERIEAATVQTGLDQFR